MVDYNTISIMKKDKNKYLSNIKTPALLKKLLGKDKSVIRIKLSNFSKDFRSYVYKTSRLSNGCYA